MGAMDLVTSPEWRAALQANYILIAGTAGGGQKSFPFGRTVEEA